MKIERKKHSLFICLIVMLLALCSLFGSISPQLLASADAYTNVYDDLNKDSTFKEADYPIIENDHTLQVISIAESADKELFVYVYQPSANHKATSISFSTQKKGKDFNMYYLKYINKFKGLYKYAVKDFEVAGDETRYYEIASIFRAWDEEIDQGLSTGETISEVPFVVGKQYILTNEETICYDIETIEITDKYVGFNRYTGGFNYWGTTDKVDSHFVAFNTDKEIDRLLEADVYFQTQKKKLLSYGHSIELTYKDVIDNYSYITSTDIAVFDGDYDGWINSSYEWQRIQTKDAFIEDCDFSNTYKMGFVNIKEDRELSAEALSAIENCKWVLRFYESLRTFNALTGVTDWTSVVNVSILRLQFENDGRFYNLGVVDNKQSSSGNTSDITIWNAWIEWTFLVLILLLIIAILLLMFAPSILLAILKFAWKCICALFKGLWWLITLPLEIFTKEDKNA